MSTFQENWDLLLGRSFPSAAFMTLPRDQRAESPFSHSRNTLPNARRKSKFKSCWA